MARLADMRGERRGRQRFYDEKELFSRFYYFFEDRGFVLG